MAENCPGPRIDALLDGELDAAAAESVRAHAAACARCAAEIDSRRALSRALARVTLPAPPRAFRAPRRRAWVAAAAAALVIAAVLLSLPAPVPELVAVTARLHDEVLRGRLTPQALGLKSVPGAPMVGRCPCPPELGPSSLFVVYRKGGVPISVLVVEGPPLRLGRDTFRVGTNTVRVVAGGKLSQVWVSALEPAPMSEVVSQINQAWRTLGGDRLTLSGIT